MMLRRQSVLRPSSARAVAGFTLIEIIVTIALMGGLAALLALGAANALNEREDNAVDIFWGAVGEARKFALHHELDVTLSFDEEEQEFLAVTAIGERRVPFPIKERVRLEFLGVEKGTQTILIGGRLVEANLLPYVHFYGDGTCSPFRARLEVEGKQPEIMEIDPWTCAPVLRDEETRF
ncbi:MAG: hypothetical protein SynsKO_10740 [Synoicihabitans sp.]